MAILTDNAGEDARFGGQSIVMQQVRSAICVPLIGSEGRALGVLYVDSLGSAHRFDEADLDFCVAFAGIAAVAIENGEFIQRIQRQVIARSNFERFFAPQIAQRIAESSETIRLGGDKRPVAVLFSDIRGFTALAESMRPDDTASLLTEYFTEMVDCVFRHDGTLDKFMGDALMAHWGAPIGGDRDADNAVAAAIDMMQALDTLNATWRTTGRPELHIGIGLNYGEAFAGNIGSERRLEFTVIGDTVNTAYRLCSAADAGEILITEELRRALKESVESHRAAANGAEEQAAAGDDLSRRRGLMPDVARALPSGFVAFAVGNVHVVSAEPFADAIRAALESRIGNAPRVRAASPEGETAHRPRRRVRSAVAAGRRRESSCDTTATADCWPV